MTAATVVVKQGNSLLRYLLVEAAQVTVRSQRYWRSKFFHLVLRRGRKILKVAMARKLAVHLYWMWRQNLDYGQFEKLGSHAGEPGNRHGGEQIINDCCGQPPTAPARSEHAFATICRSVAQTNLFAEEINGDLLAADFGITSSESS
jgi:hypothetical protein